MIGGFFLIAIVLVLGFVGIESKLRRIAEELTEIRKRQN